MAKYALAGFVALFLSLSAGALVAQGELSVPMLKRPVVVDGDLKEWPAPQLTLDRKDQVWLDGKSGRPKWGGKQDLSAQFILQYDVAHLYLAGVVKDDQHVAAAEGQYPETGDAIEVFLDLMPVNGQGDAAEQQHRLTDEDVQLFLMPLAGKWIRRPWDKEHPGRTLPPTGSELTGMQLVAQYDPASKTYAFEARIPFHNFLDVSAGETIAELGFHLAIDDRDQDHEVVHYMTLNGENPTQDTRRYIRLKFAGRGPLSPEPPTGLGLGARLQRVWPWGIVGLLVALTVVLFSRRSRLMKLAPVPARLARVAGVVLLVVGLFLPAWMAANHESEAEDRLHAAIARLEQDLPEMEKGTLKSYVGEARDAPLLSLLEGQEIQRKQFLSYQFLTEMQPKGFGTHLRSYPDEHFLVRPYWIPLPVDQPQRFPFRQTLPSGRLAIVVSEPAGTEFSVEEPTPLRLRLTYRLRGQSEDEEPIELPTTSERVPSEAFGRNNREVFHVFAEQPDGVEALSLTALGGEQVELVGLTVVPTDANAAASSWPLNLGQPMGEIESDLRGIYPEDAGFELTSHGGENLVRIPQGRRRTYHKLWFVYAATYPGEVVSPDSAEGDDVCHVTIKFSKGADRKISLGHQRAMFYELASRNKSVPDGVPAVQVEVGTESEVEDRRINVVYRADLNLPRGVTVQSIHFKNDGPYPIRFRSVIFGSERRVAPSELANSPLRLAGGKASLKPSNLEALRGMQFGVFRNGSLTQSNLPDAERERRDGIPASVQQQRLREPSATYTHTIDDGDERIFAGFIPLQQDRNVVLAVWAVDPHFGDLVRWFHLIGSALWVLAAPFLLLLFNDALAWVTNLRLRLMAVVAVASLVPLTVLFVFLVRVLEGDHEDEQRRSLRQAVQTVSDQLRYRQTELQASTRSWAKDLQQHEATFRRDAARKDAPPPSLEQLKTILGEVMRAQLPPEWKVGLMRLEYVPEDGAPEWFVPFTIDVGDTSLKATDIVLREEPGFYKASGVPIIGVRYQDDGPIRLSVARPIGPAFLTEISPSLPAILCDVRGYEMTRSEAAPDAALPVDVQSLFAQGPFRYDRLSVAAEARETRQPVYRRHDVAGRPVIAAYDMVRNAQGSPRAILGVLRPDREATLTLSVGTVPVRTFFIAIAGFLLVLSLGLASIVTSRITDPIERLEDGAEALRQGQFDVRVQSAEGGQIGRLTETFNNMAQELRGRIQDLTHLNRGIQELTSRLDLDQILNRAIAFFARHSPADRVRVLLLDYERDQVEAYGETRQDVDRRSPDLAAVLEATGTMSVRLDALAVNAQLPGLFPEHRSMLVMPLVLAGRPRGCVLLLFEASHPPAANLELLTTIAAQTAAAIENARLYRHAVEDLYTGAYVPEYFSRLVRNSVALAQEHDRPLALFGVRLMRAEQVSESLGVEGFGRYLEKVTRRLRQAMHAEAKICRADNDTLQILLADVSKRRAAEICADVHRDLVAADLDLRGASDVKVVAVAYPEEGASAEFLFHALDSKLQADAEAEGVGEPLDENGGLILSSSSMAEVVRVIQKVAPSDLTILLSGETGTGKEVLTNLIHKWSKRARGPLVKVHCAALPTGLLESELFGHEKGAFTGATHRKIGKFEQAEGGTIFLDEIGEISLSTQVKLLRVLQEREVDRVGGVQPVHVDVRVVAATNRNIEEMVAEGTFREDLYYRLQGMVLTVPSLRERRSEIPALVEVFRKEAVAAGHTAVRGFSTDAMDALFQKDWPGNIRELRNTVFRAMVLAGEGLLERSHLLGILPREEPTEDPERSAEEVPAEPAAERPGKPVEELREVSLPRPEPSGRGEGRRPQPAARPPELVGRLAALYDLIQSKGSLSNSEYCAQAGVSSRTGLRDLNELLERGLIQREGRRRGARYSVNSGETAVPGEI